jgi:hypothetical protein
LVEFTADLDWLKRQGIAVERYNLSQQTQAFISNATVCDALKKDGNDCLPLIMTDSVTNLLPRLRDRKFSQLALFCLDF